MCGQCSRKSGLDCMSQHTCSTTETSVANVPVDPASRVDNSAHRSIPGPSVRQSGFPANSTDDPTNPGSQCNQTKGTRASASASLDVPQQSAASCSSYRTTNSSGIMNVSDSYNRITNIIYSSDGAGEDSSRSQSDDVLEHPQDTEIGDSSMPGITFDFCAEIYKGTGNSTSSKPSQVLKIDGRLVVKTTRGQSEPKRVLSRSLIKFTQLKIQTKKFPGAYEQVYVEVKIDVKHKYTEVESRRHHPKFGEERHDGVVTWEFDCANERQTGIGFEDPVSLTFKFHGMSDDEPPPLPPKHFDIVVTSYWSLISPRADYSMSLRWPFFKGKLPAPEAPRYSTLCQIIKLEVPSDLSQDTYHKSAAKVNQSSCQIIIEREGSCTVTPVVFPVPLDGESGKFYGPR